MRKLLFAALALSAYASLDITPAAAQEYPYCIRGRDYPGFGDCSYPSYAACAAAASGRFAYCERNPFIQRVPDAPRPGRRVYRETY
ncbi:DUF3551 domain-containing protein [Afipia sp. 1NLS2]|jgi:hypothetical protein|uniref:DUF3551 domain-containing protein n=1 Tax=Afipia sp. 1NLS2 TaxID=666684 RepID=UPI0001D9E20C|nr:DUF3551 domain-containing protein [Afipia sp. 1NLS2]EFI50186.1 conserved hypothetical protein [Afipia sp. 1NLS2]MBE0702587.1 DUF3551 domain-containing protein [Afipia sp.]